MDKITKGGVYFIIPSLNPSGLLIGVLASIREYTEKHEYAKKLLRGIVVVNDGSAAGYDGFFERAEKDFGCKVLRHAVNLGKGRALKTAFNYILSLGEEDVAGAVTLDSDGQHSAHDAFRCALCLIEHPDSLILGVRNFDGPDVPKKSRRGNKITRFVMNLMCGVSVSDTQTGLRALPLSFMKKAMNIEGERFEYETNMLIRCRDFSIPIREVKIETIYINKNASSHFNPLRDSIKVYGYFIKYSVVAISSFLLDIVLFKIGVEIFENITPTSYIYIASAAARVLSSIYNFTLNRKVVFRDKGRLRKSMVKFYALAFVNLVLTAVLVDRLYPILPLGVVNVKIIVDILIFFANYLIQRLWIFRKRK